MRDSSYAYSYRCGRRQGQNTSHTHIFYGQPVAAELLSDVDKMLNSRSGRQSKRPQKTRRNASEYG